MRSTVSPTLGIGPIWVKNDLKSANSGSQFSLARLLPFLQQLYSAANFERSSVAVYFDSGFAGLGLSVSLLFFGALSVIFSLHFLDDFLHLIYLYSGRQ